MHFCFYTPISFNNYMHIAHKYSLVGEFNTINDLFNTTNLKVFNTIFFEYKPKTSILVFFFKLIVVQWSTAYL